MFMFIFADNVPDPGANVEDEVEVFLCPLNCKYMLLRRPRRYSLHSAERPGDTIDPGFLNEARALRQLNLNENPHAPILWDAKVEEHLTSCRTILPGDDIGEDRKHFVIN